MNDRKHQCEGYQTLNSDLQGPRESFGWDAARPPVTEVQPVFHLCVSGGEVHGLLHRQLFLPVATESKLTRTGSQHVAYNCGKYIRMLILWRGKTPAIRVESRQLLSSLADEQGLDANS